MRLVAESFAWPFRAHLSTWLWGCLCVLLLPLLFIPLLGYAVVATRWSVVHPDQPPPRWSLSGPLLAGGFWTSMVIVLTVAPFAIALNPLTGAFGDGAVERVVVFFVLLFLWGVVVLLVMPHATATFASTGSYKDVFHVAASLRGVRRDFMTWNFVVAAIVTAWAIAVASVGLLCVGIVPGVFYAILVSAHATAALHRQSSEGSPPPTG
ncbi:MAG TPA: DUF4013 domain-containing protein [Candidatus Dormibacteraeota bacterium]|nr:DUF4013 domain-containing protein [Candidatus Dormibacteraeota bacterium]